MSTITKIIAGFNTTLAEKASVGATSIRLFNNKDLDGNQLPNGYYTFTLDGNNALKEFVYGLLTDTVVTEVQSVSFQGVKTSGTKREHRYNASVSLTNFAHLKLLNDIAGGLDTLDADTPIKYDADPTIDDDKQLATKKYIDDQDWGEFPKATTVVYGGSKVSVAPVSAVAPISLSDSDPRVPTADENDAMAGSYGTPGASNKFATADNEGLTNNLITTTDQTIAGVKTFTSIPVMPGNPTTDNQIANKAYVDSLL